MIYNKHVCLLWFINSYIQGVMSAGGFIQAVCPQGCMASYRKSQINEKVLAVDNKYSHRTCATFTTQLYIGLRMCYFFDTHNKGSVYK